MEHKEARTVVFIDYLEGVLDYCLEMPHGDETLTDILGDLGVRSEIWGEAGYSVLDTPGPYGDRLDPFIPETDLDEKYSYESIQATIRAHRNDLLSWHQKIIQAHHASDTGADGGSENELTYKKNTTSAPPRPHPRQDKTPSTVNRDESLSPARKSAIHREHVESIAARRSADSIPTPNKRTRTERAQPNQPMRGAPTPVQKNSRQAYHAARKRAGGRWEEDNYKTGDDFQPGG